MTAADNRLASVGEIGNVVREEAPMRNVWMVGVIWLVACTKTADTDETDLDTDVEDTDVVDDGLFDLDVTLAIDGDLDLPAGALRAAFMPLTFHASDPWTFGAPTTETAVSGATPGSNTDFKLRFNPDPDESLFTTTEDGTEIAPFGIGAYIDVDGNNVRGPSDPLVGASYGRLVAYLRGTLSAEWTAMGAAPGWNIIDVSFIEGGGPTRFVALTDDAATDLVLDANLLPRGGDGLEITVNTSTAGSASRVGLYDIAPLLDDTNPEPVDSTLISIPADLSATGARVDMPSLPKPPLDHFTENLGDMPTGLVEAAIYVGLAWDEMGTNEDFDTDVDSGLAWSIYSGGDVQFVVYFSPKGYEAAAFPEAFGWPMGWSMIRSAEGGDPIVVDWDSGLSLESGSL
jgi:hypothetical protein